MAGIESQGMVLCASDAEKTALDFVVPPPDAPAGARFEWPGYSGEPETAKKMDKKKAWEAIQPLLRTDDKGRACYKDAPFTVASGSCTSKLDASKTLVGCASRVLSTALSRTPTIYSSEDNTGGTSPPPI
eukprot:3488711-Pleurochrysis_carterae.AAC.2